MSGYNPKNLLQQSPESIKTLILAVLTALVVRGTITISGEEAAAWGLVLERLLSVLYVAPVKKANTERDLAILHDAVAGAPVTNVYNAPEVPVGD